MRAARSRPRRRLCRPTSQYESGKVNAAKAKLYHVYVVIEILFVRGIVPDKDKTNKGVEGEYKVFLNRHRE